MQEQPLFNLAPYTQMQARENTAEQLRLVELEITELNHKLWQALEKEAALRNDLAAQSREVIPQPEPAPAAPVCIDAPTPEAVAPTEVETVDNAGPGQVNDQPEPVNETPDLMNITAPDIEPPAETDQAIIIAAEYRGLKPPKIYSLEEGARLVADAERDLLVEETQLSILNLEIKGAGGQRDPESAAQLLPYYQKSRDASAGYLQACTDALAEFEAQQSAETIHQLAKAIEKEPGVISSEVVELEGGTEVIKVTAIVDSTVTAPPVEVSAGYTQTPVSPESEPLLRHCRTSKKAKVHLVPEGSENALCTYRAGIGTKGWSETDDLVNCEVCASRGAGRAMKVSPAPAQVDAVKSTDLETKEGQAERWDLLSHFHKKTTEQKLFVLHEMVLTKLAREGKTCAQLSEYSPSCPALVDRAIRELEERGYIRTDKNYVIWRVSPAEVGAKILELEAQLESASSLGIAVTIDSELDRLRRLLDCLRPPVSASNQDVCSEQTSDLTLPDEAVMIKDAPADLVESGTPEPVESPYPVLSSDYDLSDPIDARSFLAHVARTDKPGYSAAIEAVIAARPRNLASLWEWASELHESLLSALDWARLKTIYRQALKAMTEPLPDLHHVSPEVKNWSGPAPKEEQPPTPLISAFDSPAAPCLYDKCTGHYWQTEEGKWGCDLVPMHTAWIHQFGVLGYRARPGETTYIQLPVWAGWTDADAYQMALDVEKGAFQLQVSGPQELAGPPCKYCSGLMIQHDPNVFLWLCSESALHRFWTRKEQGDGVWTDSNGKPESGPIPEWAAPATDKQRKKEKVNV